MCWTIAVSRFTLPVERLVFAHTAGQITEGAVNTPRHGLGSV